MKKIISILFAFFSFIDTGLAMAPTDDREYIDWANYPNIVRVISSKGKCTGTQIGKYVITAAHCMDNDTTFTIIKSDGTSVKADLHSKGTNWGDDDWAILLLPDESESKYTMSTEITSYFGETYGFGALRILTDEELAKIRQYLMDKKYFLLSADSVEKILSDNIPGVGYIYKDSDNLKKSPCESINELDNGVFANCLTSAGNSGGGLFIDKTKIVGILSRGDLLGYGTDFVSMKRVANTINQIQSGTCDEEFVANIFESRYPEYKGHEKIGLCYQVFKQNDTIDLTDSCGNILLQHEYPGSIKSIVYNKGVYKITSKPVPRFRQCNNRALNIVMNLKYVVTEINEKDAIDDNLANIKISVDEGKTFRHIKNVPEDLKKCLDIKY